MGGLATQVQADNRLIVECGIIGTILPAGQCTFTNIESQGLPILSIDVPMS